MKSPANQYKVPDSFSPGRFPHHCEAVIEFISYETEYFHSGIDFVTPHQAHNGLRQTTLEDREYKTFSQRRRRQVANQQKPGAQKNEKQETSSNTSREVLTDQALSVVIDAKKPQN